MAHCTATTSGTPSDLDETFMAIAIGEAKRAMEEDEVPVGAAIACGGELIAMDHNRVRSMGVATAHGEMLAIAAAARKLGDWRLSNCTLYSTKEPCPMCAGACVMSRIGRVVFAVSDQAMGCLGGGPLNFSNVEHFNHRFPVSSGVRAEESLALLRKFFSAKRRSPMQKKRQPPLSALDIGANS
ncbi:MAG: nucleoside deaminase [Puniceicoccales bacterium]|jgi:tRNA(adenine34) deaminase|nr:nucleoside deaminase [Puniceicoccales bacterium]